jgi:hypothetical protein
MTMPTPIKAHHKPLSTKLEFGAFGWATEIRSPA